MATACKGLEADHTVIARASVLASRSTSPAAVVGNPFPADQVRPIRAVVGRTSVASHSQEPEDMRHIPTANHRLQAMSSASHKHQVEP